MSEPVSGVVKEALRLSASWGIFAIDISTDNVEVAQQVLKTIGGAARDVSKAAVTLGGLYLGYKSLQLLIDSAVKKGLGGERDDQEFRDIRPGSLHVLLACSDKRFLEVLEDYESGRMKERLQEEFSQVGIKVEGLKVKIENMEEVNKSKEAINKKRYEICKKHKSFNILDFEFP